METTMWLLVAVVVQLGRTNVPKDAAVHLIRIRAPMEYVQQNVRVVAAPGNLPAQVVVPLEQTNVPKGAAANRFHAAMEGAHAPAAVVLGSRWATMVAPLEQTSVHHSAGASRCLAAMETAIVPVVAAE